MIARAREMGTWACGGPAVTPSGLPGGRRRRNEASLRATHRRTDLVESYAEYRRDWERANGVTP